MKRRCYNINCKKYPLYGGRGISVCDEWQTFEPFMIWAYANGYDPNAEYGKCSIDRIDNNGNYSPSNCRWVDYETQGSNRRNNRIITIDGVSHTASEWEKINGMKPGAIYNRISKGWTEYDAITKPFIERGSRTS